jgi:hypothetical protein
MEFVYEFLLDFYTAGCFEKYVDYIDAVKGGINK